MSITIRKAKIKDLEKTYKWTNYKDVIKNSIERTKKVSLHEHTQWFNKYIESKKNSMFIACYKNDQVGMVKIDNIKNELFVGIVIDKKHRNKKLSVQMFNKVINRQKKKVKNLILKAKIKNDNLSSIKMIEKLGFVRSPNRQNKNIILFKLVTK